MRDPNKEFIVIGVRKLDRQGGMEKHVREVTVRMAQRGWRVRVIESCLHPTSVPGVLTSAIGPVRSGGIEKAVYNLRAALAICRRTPRLVYVAGLNAGLFIWLLKLFRIKVVARLGSVDFAYPKFGLLERATLRWCFYNYKLADRVVVVNEDYLRYFPQRERVSKVKVIGNGIDTTRRGCNTEEGILERYGLQRKKYILTVGRVTPEKNCETLVDAFLRVPDRGLCLAIAGGDTGDGDRRKERSMNLAKDAPVRFLGEVPFAFMEELYTSSLCYVNASLHEGQSNAVLEALSCTAPILLSDIPGNRSLGLPEKHYFPPLDVETLARKLSRIAASPDEYVASDFTDTRFDWGRICDRIEELFIEVLSE